MSDVPEEGELERLENYKIFRLIQLKFEHQKHQDTQLNSNGDTRGRNAKNGVEGCELI